MPLDLAPETFDGLIFDCDGTLVDTAPAHFAALQIAFTHFGLDLRASWYFARVGLTPHALLDAYEAEIAPLPVSRTDLLDIYTTAFQSEVHHLREVAIVADVARAWKGRVPMAVASNGERANVLGSLSSAGLLPLFDHVLAVEDVRHGKPAPDLFLECARRLQVPPGRCLVLEDSDEGLRAAHAAGMQAIDIREIWTPEWKQALAEPSPI